MAERRQQGGAPEVPHCDSGMGTSVGDSESEAESLNEAGRGNADRNSPRPESTNASSDEGDDDEIAYNYGRAREEAEEEEEDEESSSESESEDEFMKERQITEDYSRYRENIFDFSPKGYREKKSLVEEIREEERPSTSGLAPKETVNNVDATADTEKEEYLEKRVLIVEIKDMEVEGTQIEETTNNIEEKKILIEEIQIKSNTEEKLDVLGNTDEANTGQTDEKERMTGDGSEDVKCRINDLEDENGREEEGTNRRWNYDNAADFQIMIECMQKAVGITAEDVKKATDKDSTSNGKQEGKNIEYTNIQDNKEEIDADNKVTNKEVTVNVEKTNKENDKELVKENYNACIQEKSKSNEAFENEDNISIEAMIENYTAEKTNRRLQKVIDQIKQKDLSTSIWTFDEYLDTVDKRRIYGNYTVDVEDTEDVAIDETDIESVLSSCITEDKAKEEMKITRLKTVQTRRTQNIITKSSGDDSDDNLADNEDEGLTPNLQTVSRGVNMVSEKGDGFSEYKVANDAGNNEEKAMLKEEFKTEPIGLDAETEEGIEKILQESEKEMDKNARKAAKTTQQSMATKLTLVEPNETMMSLLRGDLINDILSTSSEESDNSTDDEERPYYRKLDKFGSTEAIEIPESDDDEISIEAPKQVKSKEEIQKEIPMEKKEIDAEDQDTRYKEILTWELKVSPRDIQILPPPKKQDTFQCELAEIIAKTRKEPKPEYEITPPKDIAEENDVIMYARTVRRVTTYNQYKSMHTEAGRTIKEEDIKPPHVHKALRMSPNYSVFEKHQNEVIKKEITEESEEPESALLVCNKISEVRSQMADFMKRLDEFNERSRLAREAAIEDYNTALEKEQEIVEKLMKMEEIGKQKLTWDTKRGRKPREITESVMRQHFEDMGVIIEDDENSDEVKQNIDEHLEKELENKCVDAMGLVFQMGEDTDDISDNISCEDNIIYDEIIKTRYYVRTEIVGDDKETNVEGSVAVEDRDADSYEDCLTTNEEEESEILVLNRDIDIDYFKLAECLSDTDENTDQNMFEKSSESCDEFFTTNEEDSEEYKERTRLEYDELEDVNVEESLNYDTFMNSLKVTVNKEEKGTGREEKEMEVEDESEKEGNENEGNEDEERPIIRRNVTCSLEMQLAKKAD